jgi:hypothetical protein
MGTSPVPTEHAVRDKATIISSTRQYAFLQGMNLFMPYPPRSAYCQHPLAPSIIRSLYKYTPYKVIPPPFFMNLETLEMLISAT